MKKLNTTSLLLANIVAFAFLMFFIMRQILGSEEMTFKFSSVGILMIALGCLQIYFSMKLLKYRKEQDYQENSRDKLKRISRDINSENPTYEFKHSKFEDDISEYSDDEKEKQLRD